MLSVLNFLKQVVVVLMSISLLSRSVFHHCSAFQHSSLSSSLLLSRRISPRTARSATNQFQQFSSGKAMSKPRVLVGVADGSEEIEAVTIIDTLVRGGAEVVVASVMGKKEVKCSRGVKLVADCLISECLESSWDMICVPGGLPGAQHLSDSHAFIDLLKAQNQHRKLIGAICAAPAVVLAKHGLLQGHTATCYPGDKFVSQLPSHDSAHNVVVSGNIITSKGPGTAMEFSLKLVGALFGHEKEEQLKREMIFSHA